MKANNVVRFPAIHKIKDSYWHGNESYPSLEALDANLTDVDRHRVVVWHERRRVGGDCPSGRPGHSGGGSSAA
jgi:hypothetical protein